MLMKTVRTRTLFVASMLAVMFVAGTREADAADHRDSPVLLGPYFLSAESAAIVDEVLDILQIEPTGLPPRQTREHILLARITRSNTGTNRGGGIEFYVLHRREARLLVLLLTFLDDRDSDVVWADGFFIRFPAGTTYVQNQTSR